MGKYWRAYRRGQPRDHTSTQFSQKLPDFVSGAALDFVEEEGGGGGPQ